MFNVKTDAGKSPNHLQISALLISLLIVETPTFARQPAQKDKAAPIKETQEMIGGGNDGSCSGQISNPTKLTLPLGKSTLIKLPEPLASRTVGNQSILQAKMIAPQTLYLLGVDIGSTNMIIQGKSGACTIVDVTVSMDPDGLQQALVELMPDEKNIKVTAAAESLILNGTVEDAISANRAVDIANAYVGRVLKSVDTSTKEDKTITDKSQQSKIYGQYTEVSPRVVNLLSVTAQQQVMLDVKVAEVSKTLLDKMGSQGAFGGNKFKLLTPFFATDAAVFAALGIAPFQSVSGLVNRTAGAVTVDGTTFPPVRAVSGATETLTGGSPAVQPRGPSIGSTSGKGVSVDAEKKDGLVKILAEPSIMAISGQEGSFLAGGKIFIPVAQQNNAGGGSTITLEEKEFGVGVKFTPTVLAGGRINLKVAPEVSELDREGVGISATGFNGTAILPSFTSRRASTTVQLMDGQSFAIGGLIKNNTIANIKAFPILGEIPILGALFRSTEFQKDKTELIFIVTPHLVKPLTAKGYQLPTDNYIDPSRADIFLGGKLEGSAPKAPQAPAPANKASENPAPKQNEAMQNETTQNVAPQNVVPQNDIGFDVN